MNGVPCELSHTVSRFGGTREQRRVRASLLSSVPRAPCASFSRKNKKKVRQLENVPRRVYTPTFAPSLPKNTVTYHQYTISRRVAGTSRRRGLRLRIARKACHRRHSQPPLPIPMSMRRHQIHHHEVLSAENAKHCAEEVVMKRLRN